MSWMPVIGLDRVIANFQKIANNNTPQQQFIDTISQQTLFLLRNNSPVDTGQLRDSWREVIKTPTTLAIGTTPDQVIKLKSIIYGTRFQQPNDFLTPILEVISDNIGTVFRSQLRTSHPYLSHISGGGGMRFGHQKTPSGIVGLTGLKYVKRRGRGRSYLGIVRTGRKRLSARIGRRRRV